MQRYIGIDVHSESCTVAVMGPSGRRLQEQQIETNGRALLNFVKSIAGEKHVCIEEGTQSEWLYELLSPYVCRVVVIQPATNRGNKSDSIDAWSCAEQLRLGTYRSVYKPKGQFSALRAAVRTHVALTRDVTRAKNRLRAIYRSRGIATTRLIYRAEEREPVLAKLRQHAHLLQQARLLFEQLDSLTKAQAQAEEWLNEQAQKHPVVRRLATAPGIGPIRAAQIVAIVVVPQRFRTKRQFWSYCGLGIVTRSSADWTREPSGTWTRARTPLARGLNRKRNPLLKCIFKGAAHLIVTHAQGPLKDAYYRLLEKGIKPNLAELTLARRLAAAVLAMWKQEQDFDPTRV